MLVAQATRRLRLAALTGVALMLVPSFLALAPLASAQILPGIGGVPNYAITEAFIGDVAGESRTFVDGGKDLKVTLTIVNQPTGIGNPSVPVVVYDATAFNASAPGSAWMDCAHVQLSPGSSTQVTLTLRLPHVAEASAANHTIKMWVNRNWTEQENVQFSGQNPCTPGQVVDETGGQQALASRRLDNARGAFVIIDHRFNLRATALKLCQEGGEQPGATCDPTQEWGSKGPYSRVEYDAPGANSRDLTFQFVIDNDDANATWNRTDGQIDPNSCVYHLDTPHYDSDCVHHAYQFDYKISYQGVQHSAEKGVAVEASVLGFGTHANATDKHFNLYRRAGNYTFTLKIDHNNTVAETNDLDNTISQTQEVLAPNLKPVIRASELRTDAAHPYHYGDDGTVYIPLNATMANVGDWTAKNYTNEEAGDGTGQPIWYRVYLDKIDDSNGQPYLRWNRSVTAVPMGENVSSFVDTIKGKNDDSASRITPGKHTIIMVVDPQWSTDVRLCAVGVTETCARSGQAFESSEADNKLAIDVYVEDDERPVLSDFKLNGVGGNASDPHALTLNQSETTHWRVNVTESDASVKVNLTIRDANGNWTSTPMTKISDDPNGKKHLYGLDLVKGYKPVGNYLAYVNATDSAGNKANNWAFNLRIQPWRIQRMPESDIFFSSSSSENPANGTKFGVSEQPVKFHIKVDANDTGVYPVNTTKNKNIDISYPESGHTSDTMSSAEHGCPPAGAPVIPGLPQQQCQQSNEFVYNVAANEIGHYYVWINVTDWAGIPRVLFRTFTVEGPIPEIQDWEIAGVHSPSVATVDAGALVHIRVNVTSAEDLLGVFAVFKTVTGNYSWNQSLALTDGTVNGGNWTTNMTTGFGKNLTNGGAYTLKFAAVDSHGTWGFANTTFTLQDSQVPTLTSARATPASQEIGLDVAFNARADDNTNYTVKLTIKRDTSEIVQIVTMKAASPADHANYSFKRNFTVPGSYSAIFEVTDSVGLKAPPLSQDFQIAENLAPRIEIKQPSFQSSAGERFGSATPRLQFFISDRDGVIENSITMHVITLKSDGSTLVDKKVDLLPSQNIVASRNPPGFALTYDWPGTLRFTHNTTVKVVVNATDNSTKHLFEPVEERFRVDAKPPTSGPPKFIGDKWQELDTDPMTISPSTLIQLSASENADGAHTDVKAIRYNVLRTTASGDFVYSDAEKISFRDLFKRGVTNLGSGPYKLQYFATDAVDNAEQTAKTYDVYLDDLPPSPDLFATRPQGKFVNATWVDNHAGVARVVTWYRNGPGIFQPLEMRLRSDVWQTEIPGGKKGDTICYFLQAWDRVNNTANLGNQTQPYSCYPVGNQVPTIAVLEPGDNAKLDGVRTIRWQAHDPDGDALTFKIFYRLVGKQTFQELASLPAGSDRYSFDTAKLADGTYELQVQTTDGNFVAFQTLKVVILNSKEAFVGTPTVPDRVRPDEEFLVTAVVKKSGAQVEARIFRDGNLVQTVAMHDDGLNGDAVAGDSTYSALVKLTDGGSYTVDFYAKYEEDGQLKEVSLPNAGHFSVSLSPADVITTYASLWVAIGALVVACVGVGGYALFRRWKA